MELVKIFTRQNQNVFEDDLERAENASGGKPCNSKVENKIDFPNKPLKGMSFENHP